MEYQPVQCETNVTGEGDDEEYIKELQCKLKSSSQGDEDIERLLSGEVDHSDAKTNCGGAKRGDGQAFKELSKQENR